MSDWRGWGEREESGGDRERAWYLCPDAGGVLRQQLGLGMGGKLELEWDAGHGWGDLVKRLREIARSFVEECVDVFMWGTL